MSDRERRHTASAIGARAAAPTLEEGERAAGGPAGARPQPWARGWRRARRRPMAVAGALVVALFAVAALAAPLIQRDDPLRTDWSMIRKPPSWAHPFGTDDLGRDTFSRVVWGTRVSMQAG